MRLKPKVLFLIGGLAVISAVSSQNTANIVVSKSPLQTDKTTKQLYVKTQLNKSDLAITINSCSQVEFSA